MAAPWWRRSWWLAGPVVLAAVALALWLWPRGDARLRLATGSAGGAQEVVGQALVEAVARRMPHVDMDLVATGGGQDNVQRLLDGEADLAIVPNDQLGDERLRSVAPLYREYLHVVVTEGVTTIRDLAGRRVATGPEGSHTAAISAWLFPLLQVEPAALVHGESHRQSAEMLIAGKVDAALVLAGVPTPAVKRMLAHPGLRLLSLAPPDQVGSVLEGLQLNAPNLSTTVIPIGTYGLHPQEAVGTLGCDTLLLTRDDVDRDLVRDFTAALFAHRAALGDRAPELARLSERFDAASLRFPVHAGAEAFYARKEPPFIVEWADAISLLITTMLLAWSGAAAIHSRLRRKRKDRVDRYYAEIQSLADDLADAEGIGQLREIRDRLRALRRRAFSELAAERLAADESFTIFQDYLRSELAEVEAAITQLGYSQRPPPP